MGVAGVVVSCKIPILATRVRFPGDAHMFYISQDTKLLIIFQYPHGFRRSARVA